MKKRKISRTIQIGMVIGILYALLFWFSFIAWRAYFGYGDPGPSYLFIIPIFWPALLTYIISGGILAALHISDLFLYAKNIEILINILNIFLCMLIGGIIGRFIQKRREQKSTEIK